VRVFIAAILWALCHERTHIMKVIGDVTEKLVTLKAVGKGINRDSLDSMKEICKSEGMWFSWGMHAWCMQKSVPDIRQKLLTVTAGLATAGFTIWIPELHRWLEIVDMPAPPSSIDMSSNI